MAIAKLSRVVLICSRGELGHFLARLCSFGKFHPSERDDLVQDPEILLAASRYHAVYSDARSILGRAAGRTATEEITTLHAEDAIRFPEFLSELLRRAETELAASPGGAPSNETTNRVAAISVAAEMLFDDLRRIRVVPSPRRYVVVEGYVPTRSSTSFEEAMGQHILSMEEAEARLPGEPYIPTLLVNPRIISLFESTTLTQGVPSYNQIDPTPFVAFFFPFFFGIMFADVGRGLALFVAGWYVARRWRSKYLYWGRMLSVFGVSATLFGLFSGLFFGLPFATPFPRFIPVLDLSNLDINSVILLLEISIVIGTFHLAAAYYIAFANEMRSGNRLALLTSLPVLVLYSSLVPFSFAVVGNGISLTGIFTNSSPTPVFLELLGLRISISLVASASLPVVLSSLFVLVFGEAVFRLVSSPSIRGFLSALAKGATSAMVQPFEFLVNTISYIRLGVLLIVSTLTGALVNRSLILGPAALPLFVAANAAVMLLEGLIVYVQDLRLHVYEWFTKLYFGRGAPFSPLVSQLEGVRVDWSQARGAERL